MRTIGQREVYDSLDALGGRARMESIMLLTFKNNRNLKRHAVWHSMKGLRNMGYVDYDPKKDEYVIVAKFPPRNVVRLKIARAPSVAET